MHEIHSTCKACGKEFVYHRLTPRKAPQQKCPDCIRKEMRERQRRVTMTHAMDRLADYCIEHCDCEACMFYAKGLCYFKNGFVPAEWRGVKKTE